MFQGIIYFHFLSYIFGQDKMCMIQLLSYAKRMLQEGFRNPVLKKRVIKLIGVTGFKNYSTVN